MNYQSVQMNVSEGEYTDLLKSWKEVWEPEHYNKNMKIMKERGSYIEKGNTILGDHSMSSCTCCDRGGAVSAEDRILCHG